MEGNPIDAKVGVVRGPAIGIGDHQVNVERDRGNLLDALCHLKSERQVRHKVIVHNVNVHEIRVRNLRDVPLKIHEIGRQNAGVNSNRHNQNLSMRQL